MSVCVSPRLSSPRFGPFLEFFGMPPQGLGRPLRGGWPGRKPRLAGRPWRGDSLLHAPLPLARLAASFTLAEREAGGSGPVSLPAYEERARRWSLIPSLRQLDHTWLWTTCGSGPGHECMHVVTGWGLLGPCPPRNGGRSPPHKESSPKAIWDDPYVSPPMTVSMENGVGPAPGSPEKQPGSPSPPSIPETGQGATKGEGGTPAPASLPGGSKEEEEKAKRLLYCALCKVAVNSLSQLEAHNKGTDSPSCPCKALSSPTTAPYLPAPRFPPCLTL